MIEVKILDNDISREEAQKYVEYMKKEHPEIQNGVLEISTDGDYVNLDLSESGTAKPFERVRRITGYLVGTLDKFNDAKRSEVEERVKHDI